MQTKTVKKRLPSGLFKVSCIGITILVFLVAMLEIYVRIRYTYYLQKNRKILYLEAGAQADQFIDTQNKGKGLCYYDYHLFAMAPCKTKVETYTEYFSARSCPDSYPLGEGDIIIWLFGGSTMQDSGTTDKLTIANSIALSLKGRGIKATVFNFGVGSFQSSLESIKFQDLLRRVDRSERPNFTVFYDGYNDSSYTYLSGAGNMQIDLSGKLEMLITGKNTKLFIYSISNILRQYSYLWRWHIARKIEAALFLRNYKPFTDKQNLIRGVEIYVLNTQMIRAICREFRIKPVFILQPMIFAKGNLTNFERGIMNSLRPEELNFAVEFYKIARNRMQAYADFVDLTDIFDHSKRNDFCDIGHTGPYSDVVIGYRIAEIIASQAVKGK